MIMAMGNVVLNASTTVHQRLQQQHQLDESAAEEVSRATTALGTAAITAGSTKIEEGVGIMWIQSRNGH